jgi:hypothetical protein
MGMHPRSCFYNPTSCHLIVTFVSAACTCLPLHVALLYGQLTRFISDLRVLEDSQAPKE